MAYDERLAERIRRTLPAGLGIAERKMFGGLAFMVAGHMCVGASRSGGLLVRVGPDARDATLARAHTRPMFMGGKMVAAFVYVDPPGIRTAAALERWIERALAFVETLPAKTR